MTKDPTAWLNNLSCDLGLMQHVDAHIKSENDNYTSRNKVPSWYPSDLGYDLWHRFAKRKGLEAKPFDERTLRKFEIGKLWESRIHDAIEHQIKWGDGSIKELDLHPEAEGSMKCRVEDNDLELRGYYDRMLLAKVGDEWWVVVYEVKSVNSRVFHHQKKEGEQPRGNRMQLQFYLRNVMRGEYWQKICANAQEMYGITPTKCVGVLTQVSKDDGVMWERVYTFDEELYKEIHQEIKTLNEYWEKDEFPPRPQVIVIENGIAKVNWAVKYSNYLDHLYGDEQHKVIADAESLSRKHAYRRKNKPHQVGEIELEIRAFNKMYE